MRREKYTPTKLGGRNSFSCLKEVLFVDETRFLVTVVGHIHVLGNERFMVFPIIAPLHKNIKNIVPHYGIFAVIGGGGATGYLTTKLGGGL